MIGQKDFDVIAVGSGHNGLVAAAYLAKAGKRVLVLERNAWLGGGVVSRELTLPGFRHDQHSMTHIFIQANPLLQRDELGLKSRYGLRYLFPDSPMMSVFEDGSTLALYRDPAKSAAEIAKFSKNDAEAFLRLSAQAAAWLPMLVSTLYTPPMPQGAGHAFLDQSREGQQFWRAMQMSSHDVLADYFEHDQVRAHFARVAGENLVSPDEKATGLGVFVFLGFLEAYGFGVPVGGSGKLTEALIRCIEDRGRHGARQPGGARGRGRERPRRRCHHCRWQPLPGARGRHRRHPSAPAVHHGAGPGPAGAQGGRGHPHHRSGLCHGARGAGWPAALPHPRSGAVGDDRADAAILSSAA